MFYSFPKVLKKKKKKTLGQHPKDQWGWLAEPHLVLDTITIQAHQCCFKFTKGAYNNKTSIATHSIFEQELRTPSKV